MRRKTRRHRLNRNRSGAPVPQLFHETRSHRRPVCRYCLNYHELESFVGQDKDDLATVAEQH